MAVVETRDLTKVFKEGELGAVNRVNLESREGEFLVLLGPSGSGKTTLLRMIAGLEEPTSGEILIGGRIVNDLTPRDRDGFSELRALSASQRVQQHRVSAQGSGRRQGEAAEASRLGGVSARHQT